MFSARTTVNGDDISQDPQMLPSAPGDAVTLEAALIESNGGPGLNVVERARAYAALSNEHGLTYEQIGKRVGHSRSTVSFLVRLLNLSEEILGYLERGELAQHHGRVLLTIKDPAERGQIARQAAAEGWSAEAIEKQTQDIGDMARTVAQTWGDALGVEVGVRTLLKEGGFRVEIVFNSAQAALAVARRLGDTVARGSQGR